MKEAQFWQLVKRNLPQPGEVWERVESTSGSGVTDIIAVVDDGPVYFIELKIVRGNQIPLRPSQVAWITKVSRLRAPVFILARKGDVVKLFEGCDVIKILTSGWKTPCLFKTSKPFDWVGLREAIDKN